MLEMAATHGHPQTRDRRTQVLDEVGNARERTLAQGGGTIASAPARAIASRLIVLQDNGVERRINGFGARDCRIDQFPRADLAAAHELGQADRVVVEILGLQDSPPLMRLCPVFLGGQPCSPRSSAPSYECSPRNVSVRPCASADAA